MTRVTIVCEPDAAAADSLRTTLGGVARVFDDLEQFRQHVASNFSEDTIVVGPGVSEVESFAIADFMRVHRPALGVILVRTEVTTPLLQEALRAGVREVVDLRDTLGLQSAAKRSQALSAALREQAAGAAAPAPSAGGPVVNGTVITVFSAKGGCGKTTLATNLAAALADRGRRQVVVVDLDLSFGDVAIALQLFPQRTIADAVPMAATLDPEGIQQILTTHSPGLSALVAPIEPGAAEGIPASLVTALIEQLRQHFDYVVIDTPPAFDDQVLAAFDVSDVIALIATLDVPALKNLKLTLETLDLLNYPRDRWQVVLNRADSKVGLTVKDVEETLRTSIAAHIPSSRDVPAAINRGVPIVLDDPKHAVSVAIRDFAERQIAHAGAARTGRARAEDVRGERRSLLRKRRTRG